MNEADSLLFGSAPKVKRKRKNKKLDLAGMEYGYLKVLSESTPTINIRGYEVRIWNCICKCGKTVKVLQASFRNGRTKSCGCFSKETFVKNLTKHGLHGSDGYYIWKSMRDRCNNPKHPKWNYYGGRGISVCGRWNDFAKFIGDMGPRPTPSHSIDRKNNDGNYEHDNCHWATRIQQARNKRNNHIIEFNGRALCLAEWSKETGFSKGALERRLKSKWPIALMLTKPVRLVPPRKMKLLDTNVHSV